jgi:hypothetical protein
MVDFSKLDADSTVDRRIEERRSKTPNSDTLENGESNATAVQPPRTSRRKVERRRQIDPTTCERDYTDDEVEFMKAMDEYKRSSGRQFPTWSEVLEVVKNLGYSRD